MLSYLYFLRMPTKFMYKREQEVEENAQRADDRAFYVRQMATSAANNEAMLGRIVQQFLPHQPPAGAPPPPPAAPP